MRSWGLWVWALALGASAGCIADDPPSAATPTPTSPEPSPATPGVTPKPTVPSPTPAPPPPETVYNRSFDFSTEGDPTGRTPRVETTEPVSEEHAQVRVNVSLVRSSAAPTSLPVSGTIGAPKVVVLDPDGAEVLAVSAEGETREETLPAKAGEYSVRYEGAGTLRATVLIAALT